MRDLRQVLDEIGAVVESTENDELRALVAEARQIAALEVLGTATRETVKRLAEQLATAEARGRKAAAELDEGALYPVLAGTFRSVVDHAARTLRWLADPKPAVTVEEVRDAR